MTDKLNPKQDIRGGADLTVFIQGAETPKPQKESVPQQPKRRKQGAGRPSDVSGEPRSAAVVVKFTVKEKEALEAQAQGKPLSSFVRSLLKDQGYL